MNITKIIEQFHRGFCLDAYQVFGAHYTVYPEEGTEFRVWAPHARSIQVIGEFNEWGRTPIWLKRESISVFSGFVKGVKEGCLYRYLIECADGSWIYKSDPFAFCSELRPATASIVTNLKRFYWDDEYWMKHRSVNFDRPMSIYEVHAGAWMTKEDGQWLNYRELAEKLIPYVKEHGFTHVELMPLNEHPYDGSWGYQASGYYSCTSRYGTPEDFMAFVNEAHKAQIGVIMDVVPVHFAKDNHGLRYFDGSALFEYSRTEDALSQWGTCNFDLWKEEVRSFLMSSVAFWCEIYHMDGIRMDAISNVIYWGGNKERGINQGALDFARRMNQMLKERFPQVMLIAEDSSDYPKVTGSVWENGLGFDYKWDLGWMNDTLRYYAIDPIYRKYDHHKLTFSMYYFYFERFLLPLSHDEVVHGKKTIVDKMWGTYDQQFAQARNLYLYMFTHPGKKLNFMGNELGMLREFNENQQTDWMLLKYPKHDSFHRLFTDINRIYCTYSAFHDDYNRESFRWIDADNAEQSIYSYYREDEEHIFITVLNMTPNCYSDFRLGVPVYGTCHEIINTEKDIYDGCNLCNDHRLRIEKIAAQKQKYSMVVQIAPFAGILFKVKKRKTSVKKT